MLVLRRDKRGKVISKAIFAESMATGEHFDLRGWIVTVADATGELLFFVLVFNIFKLNILVIQYFWFWL